MTIADVDQLFADQIRTLEARLVELSDGSRSDIEARDAAVAESRRLYQEARPQLEQLLRAQGR